MKNYVIGGIVIVALGLLIFSGRGGNEGVTPTASASEIVVEQSTHDFGEIDIFGGKVSTDYTLKNTGTEDVTVTSGFTSCMCTEGEIGGESFGMHDNKAMSIVIPAGDSETLTAIYDPLAHGPEGTGPITRELFLKTNSSVTPELNVKFSGNVIKNG